MMVGFAATLAIELIKIEAVACVSDRICVTAMGTGDKAERGMDADAAVHCSVGDAEWWDEVATK